MDAEQQTKDIDRKIILVNVIDFPGAVLAGLGFYGYFAEGEAFVEFLNDPANAVAMILVGGGIMLWGGWQTFKLLQQKAALSSPPVRDKRVDP